MIFGDFAKALGQLSDPRFRRVLALGLGLTFILLFCVYAVFLTGLNLITPDTVNVPWVGEITWVDDLLSIGSILLMLAFSVILMVPVASAFTGLFLEDIAEAVEARHYPEKGQVARIGFAAGLQESLNFLAILIVANILALILYLFMPFAAPLIFWGLNGFLLGREYFHLVAMRWIGRDGAKALRKRHIAEIWLAGALMAVPLTIPLVNLIIPILGVATFTHLFHRLNRD